MKRHGRHVDYRVDKRFEAECALKSMEMVEVEKVVTNELTRSVRHVTAKCTTEIGRAHV